MKKYKRKISKNFQPSHAEIKNLIELFQNGLYDDAELIAQSITKEFPKYQFAWKVLGVIFTKTNRVNDALVVTKKAVKLFPQDAHAHLNLGIIFKKLGKLNKAKDSYRQAISLKSNYAEAHNNLGNVFEEMGRFEDAVSSYRNAISFNISFAEAHNNLGVAFEKLGQSDNAESSYKKAIALNSEYAEAYNNLGNVLAETGRLEDAEISYRKAIKFKHNYFEAHNNLGNVLRLGKKYEEATYHFDFLKTDFGTALSLECLYLSKKYIEFEKRLNALSLLENVNLRVAALSSFAAQQLKKKDPYPFCKNPIDFVLIQNISDYDLNSGDILDEIIKETDEYQLNWEARTTKFGFQGPSDIFEKPSKIILVLEKIIQQAITTYYNNFKLESNLFMKLWPKKYKLSGWYNRLVKNGHHTSHIHQTGWLSGVIYLKTINIPNSDEGAIEFGLHGYDLPIVDANYPRKIHKPKRGDIVLFPSSLFHRTIPFKIDSERSTIAFDLKAI